MTYLRHTGLTRFAASMHALAGSSLVMALLCTPGTAYAQCPDGSMEPCRSVGRRTPPDPRATSRLDSSTAVVVPLTPVGTDPLLRRLGVDFSTIVAANLTVGDVRALLVPEIERLASTERTAAAARRRAGALVEGSLALFGAAARATVRLVDIGTNREVTSITVQGHPDSLLEMADRASLPWLKAWWRKAPSRNHFRGALTTTSLRALRHYIVAMEEWRRGRSASAQLDSAVTLDRDFIAAWTWLGLTTTPASLSRFRAPPGMSSGINDDSAMLLLPEFTRSLREGVQDLSSLLPIEMVLQAGSASGTRVTRTLGLAIDPAPSCSFSLAGSVETLYVCALIGRNATFAGYPDTAAIRLARAALRADSSFAPAWRLLFEQVVDRGDGAEARSLLNRRFAPNDTTPLRESYERVLRQRLDDSPEPRRLPVRFFGNLDLMKAFDFNRLLDNGDLREARRRAESEPDSLKRRTMLALISAQPLEGATARDLLRWRRFDLLLKKRPTADSSNTGAPATTLFTATDYGLLIATGRHDSVRAITRRFSSVIPQAGARTFAVNALQGDALTLPPDTSFERFGVTLADLDTLIARAPPRPGNAITRALEASSRKRSLAFGAWLIGVRANERRDSVTARRALALLDSIASDDTVRSPRYTLRPLALGLRAEIAIATDTGAAEAMLAATLRISLSRTPTRYRLMLARIYAGGGHSTAALALVRSITMPSSLHDDESVLYYADALKLEAEMLERLGRPNEALRRYREYVTLRAGADAPLQADVSAARAAIARLEKVALATPQDRRGKQSGL